MDKRQQLEEAIRELDSVNTKLMQLASRNDVYTQYTIDYAKVFCKHKTSLDNVKTPSDELCKQLTNSDEELKPALTAYNSVKYETEIYLKLSSNFQAKIFALKASIQDEGRSENSQI